VFISSWKGKSAYKAQLFGSSTPKKGRKKKEKKDWMLIWNWKP